jgi:hypothetical protein
LPYAAEATITAALAKKQVAESGLQLPLVIMSARRWREDLLLLITRFHRRNQFGVLN